MEHRRRHPPPPPPPAIRHGLTIQDRRIPTQPPLATRTDTLCAKLVFLLETHRVPPRLQLLSTTPYIYWVPHLLGRAPCLDHACDLLASTLLLQMARQQAESLRPLRCRAISSLQTSLSSPAAGATETLLSLLVLQTADHLAPDTSQTRRNRHAAGLRALIQYRGPLSFADPLDRAILNAELGCVVLGCVEDGVGCFLSDLEWGRVFAPDEARKRRRPAHRAELECLALWTGVPELLVEWSRLRRHRNDTATAVVRHQIGEFKGDLAAWWGENMGEASMSRMLKCRPAQLLLRYATAVLLICVNYMEATLDAGSGADEARDNESMDLAEVASVCLEPLDEAGHASASLIRHDMEMLWRKVALEQYSVGNVDGDVHSDLVVELVER